MSHEHVHVDNVSTRGDADALEGHFARVTEGPHKGRFGTFERVLDANKTDGYPKTVLFRTRDDKDELLSVAYKSLEPASQVRR